MSSQNSQALNSIVISDDETDSIVDLTSGDNDYDSDSTLSGDANVLQRNGPIVLPSILVDHKRIIVRNIVLRKNDSAQLEDGTLFRIKHIIKNLETDAITLRGWRFRRNESVQGMLQSSSNEVHLVGTIDDDDPREALTQCMEDFPAQNVVRKCKIEITNEFLPQHIARRDAPQQNSDPSFRVSLTCRWVYLEHYKNSVRREHNERHRLKRRSDSSELRLVRSHECDEGRAVPDAVLASAWLGYLPRPSTVLTAGDAFCGAGGFSMGVSNARGPKMGDGIPQTKVEIKWAFDRDPAAIETYRRNRPETYAFLANAHEMIALISWNEHHVAILHISPPCQPHSPAHTSPGQHDEENQAALFAVGELVKRVRPRIVTLEETSGILTHNVAWFRPLVEMLTSLGYSVRWKLCRFDEDGLCQTRKRLVIIASCPGGVLPPFAKPKYGPESSGQRPYRTIADALAPLADASNVRNHNVAGAAASRSRPRPPYSPYVQLKGCITTGGGESYHPSGRPWTIRELALLQSLPIGFEFGRGGLTAHRRQIGNMVPPVAAEALINVIIRHLHQEDLERQFEARL